MNTKLTNTTNRRTRRRAGALGALSATTAAGLVLGAGPARATDRYNPSWTRDNAVVMAFSACLERYDQSPRCLWFDNNVEDPNEGVDCSGLVGKAWGLPVYSPPERCPDQWIPNTEAWYGGSVAHVKPVGDPYFMNTFVYRKSDGSGGHMGLFNFDRGDGTWATIEARDYGIPVGGHQRSISGLRAGCNSKCIYTPAKFFKRENW